MSVPRGKQTRRGGNALQEEGGVRRRGLCLLKRIITTVPLGRDEGGRGRGDPFIFSLPKVFRMYLNHLIRCDWPMLIITGCRRITSLRPDWAT